MSDPLPLSGSDHIQGLARFMEQQADEIAEAMAELGQGSVQDAQFLVVGSALDALLDAVQWPIEDRDRLRALYRQAR